MSEIKIMSLKEFSDKINFHKIKIYDKPQNFSYNFINKRLSFHKDAAISIPLSFFTEEVVNSFKKEIKVLEIYAYSDVQILWEGCLKVFNSEIILKSGELKNRFEIFYNEKEGN